MILFPEVTISALSLIFNINDGILRILIDHASKLGKYQDQRRRTERDSQWKYQGDYQENNRGNIRGNIRQYQGNIEEYHGKYQGIWGEISASKLGKYQQKRETHSGSGFCKDVRRAVDLDWGHCKKEFGLKNFFWFDNIIYFIGIVFMQPIYLDIYFGDLGILDNLWVFIHHIGFIFTFGYTFINFFFPNIGGTF